MDLVNIVDIRNENENNTCCFNATFSCGDFFVKLDRKDKGNTNAALPTRTSPNSIELTPTEVPGLANRI